MMEIKLSDGTVIHIDESVVAQDQQWQERLRELISARSRKNAATTPLRNK